MNEITPNIDSEFTSIRAHLGNDSLLSSHVSEDTFALAELQAGRKLHCSDGVWWIRKAPFYCMPLDEFKSYPRGSVRPTLTQSLLGFSHRVDEPLAHGYSLRWNMIDGTDLQNFSLPVIAARRRSYVRQGVRNCQLQIVKDIEPILPQLRDINIVQARRFEALGDQTRSFLPSSYYTEHEQQWARDLLRHFEHPAHTLITASLDGQVVAYVDLIQIESTWLFGAVKSHDDYMNHRPVDALYYYILSCASLNPFCERVVNGGGWEREGLIQFKSQFLMTSQHLHYHTHSFIPRRLIEPAKRLFNRL